MVQVRTKSSVHRIRILYVLHCDCGKHGSISVHHAWKVYVEVEIDVNIDVEVDVHVETDDEIRW